MLTFHPAAAHCWEPTAGWGQPLSVGDVRDDGKGLTL